MHNTKNVWVPFRTCEKLLKHANSLLDSMVIIANVVN